MTEGSPSEPVPQPARRRSRWLGWLRLALLYAALGAWVVFSRPTPTAVTAGLLVALLGEALRFWAAGYLHKTAELATGGPYRYTRNPLYLGRLLIFTGIGLMARLPYHANLALLLAGYVLFFGFYLPRKERIEPARLREVHGAAYERYHSRVPALLPGRRPYRPDPGGGGWSSDRLVRNREHWMLFGVTALGLFLLYRAYFR